MLNLVNFITPMIGQPLFSCKERQHAIASLRRSALDATIDWEAYEDSAKSAEGECLLWLLAHQPGLPENLKLEFFNTFSNMVLGDLQQFLRGRPVTIQLILINLNRVIRAVKGKHPGVDMGQRVARC